MPPRPKCLFPVSCIPAGSPHLRVSVSVCVSVAQSCPTLCNPEDCSPPGSSVHGILQARILEWVAYFLLQGIVPTQGLNLHPISLLHWQAGSLPLGLPGEPSQVVGLQILMSFSGPFNLASGGLLAGPPMMSSSSLEPTLWNSGKAMEAGVLPTRNGKRKELHAQEPQRVLLHFINFFIASVFKHFSACMTHKFPITSISLINTLIKMTFA